MSDKLSLNPVPILLSASYRDIPGGSHASLSVYAEDHDGDVRVYMTTEISDGPSGLSSKITEHGLTAQELLDKASALQKAAQVLLSRG